MIGVWYKKPRVINIVYLIVGLALLGRTLWERNWLFVGLSLVSVIVSLLLLKYDRKSVRYENLAEKGSA